MLLVAWLSSNPVLIVLFRLVLIAARLCLEGLLFLPLPGPAVRLPARLLVIGLAAVRVDCLAVAVLGGHG